jgi:hypothetical protein
VIVTCTGEVTVEVVIVNVPDAAPDAIVKLGDKVADPEVLESVTTAPPAGAAPSNVTVAVALVPPITLVELTVNVEISGWTENKYEPEPLEANLFAVSA